MNADGLATAWSPPALPVAAVEPINLRHTCHISTAELGTV